MLGWGQNLGQEQHLGPGFSATGPCGWKRPAWAGGGWVSRTLQPPSELPTVSFFQLGSPWTSELVGSSLACRLQVVLHGYLGCRPAVTPPPLYPHVNPQLPWKVTLSKPHCAPVLPFTRSERSLSVTWGKALAHPPAEKECRERGPLAHSGLLSGTPAHTRRDLGTTEDGDTERDSGTERASDKDREAERGEALSDAAPTPHSVGPSSPSSGALVGGGACWV